MDGPLVRYSLEYHGKVIILNARSVCFKIRGLERDLTVPTTLLGSLSDFALSRFCMSLQQASRVIRWSAWWGTCSSWESRATPSLNSWLWSEIENVSVKVCLFPNNLENHFKSEKNLQSIFSRGFVENFFFFASSPFAAVEPWTARKDFVWWLYSPTVIKKRYVNS